RRAAQLALALTFSRRATHVERRSGGATRTIAETGRNRVLCIGFSLKNGFAPKRERQKPSSRKTAMRSGPANPCARRDPCRFPALSLPNRHRNGRAARRTRPRRRLGSPAPPLRETLLPPQKPRRRKKVCRPCRRTEPQRALPRPKCF